MGVRNKSQDLEPEATDLVELVAQAQGQRIVWTAKSQDLNVNLIVLNPGEQIEEHCNDEVDVLIVGVDGAGEFVVDGSSSRVTPNTALILPRGSARSVRPLGAPFAYLTCHRQRKQLWPKSEGRRNHTGESESD